MFRFTSVLPALALAAVVSAGPVSAQTPAHDPSARLQEVLPPDVAQRVLATISEARARQLPAVALENRALKFAAHGVDPAEIERSVAEHAARMSQGRSLIAAARGSADADEIEAAADALRKGVDGQAVSELARSAPSGRSLAVPLFVIGSLVERGLPSDAALQRVHEGLMARATDAELQRLPEVAAQRRPAQTGREVGTARSGGAAGAAGGVRPATPPRPTGRP